MRDEGSTPEGGADKAGLMSGSQALCEDGVRDLANMREEIVCALWPRPKASSSELWI